MTRLDLAFGHMNRHIEKFRKKCLDSIDGIVQALIEEEMRIRREETDERIRKTHQREEPRGA